MKVIINLPKSATALASMMLSDEMEQLIHKVHEVLKLCLSYKVVSRTPVIRYNFKTSCKYLMDGDEVVPNGYYLKNYKGSEWKCGTVKDCGFSSTDCFGVNVFARPYMKRVVEYTNGNQKIFYDPAEFDNGSYMKCLRDFGGMNEGMQNVLYEMEGTEKNAKFFVDILKSICIFNERLKGLLESNSLESLINSQKELSFIK